VTADLHSLTVVALVGSHELDPAVAVPVVVTVNKRGDFQERCHSSAAIQAVQRNGMAKIGVGSSVGLLAASHQVV
jgi:hypothetical protein